MEKNNSKRVTKFTYLFVPAWILNLWNLDADIKVIVDHKLEFYWVFLLNPWLSITIQHFFECHRWVLSIQVNKVRIGNILLKLSDGLINIDVFDMYEPKYGNLQNAYHFRVLFLENVVLAIGWCADGLSKINDIVHEVYSVF